MENAALNAIRPFLDARESAVGTAVDVQHFGVRDGRGNQVEGRVGKIGSGTHQRIVIDLRSFNERLAKKRSY